MARLKIVVRQFLDLVEFLKRLELWSNSIVIFSSPTPKTELAINNIHQREDPLVPHQIRCAKKKVVSKMRWKLLPQLFQDFQVWSIKVDFSVFREHLRTVGTSW